MEEEATEEASRVVQARELTRALGLHTPLTPEAHVVRSEVEELLDEIEAAEARLVRHHGGHGDA